MPLHMSLPILVRCWGFLARDGPRASPPIFVASLAHSIPSKTHYEPLIVYITVIKATMSL